MSCWRMIAVSLMSAMLFLGSGPPLSAETTIITDGGQEHVGDVIAAGVNTLTMKMTGTGYQIVPVKSIASIKVDIADGSPIQGKLIDWSNGEMIVRVGDRDVGVRDGVITSVIDVGVAAGGPNLPAPSQPAVDEQPEAVEPATPENAPTNATM